MFYKKKLFKKKYFPFFMGISKKVAKKRSHKILTPYICQFKDAFAASNFENYFIANFSAMRF